MADPKDREAQTLAWLSYLGILLIIPLLVYKDNEFAKFHVKQGLSLLVADIAWGIAGFILGFVPILGWLISVAGWLFLFVLMVMGILNAASGKKEPLPVIGRFAESFKF